jgi:hypothetical protein
VVTTGDRVRDSIADSESFTPASQGGRLRSEWVADFRRNRWPDCVGISGRLASDYAFLSALNKQVAGSPPQRSYVAIVSVGLIKEREEYATSFLVKMRSSIR